MTSIAKTRSPRAFVLRIAPSNIDRVDEALSSNELVIGWSYSPGLLNSTLSWQDFRKILHDQYYSASQDYRRSGSAAGNMWRFIREMQEGDLVVVPHGGAFYVAKVTGPAYHDPSKLEEDTAFRRPVEWLNDKKPIQRRKGRSALQSRMKIQNTCAEATDLVGEITELLETEAKGATPSFEEDLRSCLITTTLQEIRSGRIDPYGFERLVQSLLYGLGASDVRIVPRSKDKGADLVAKFKIANTFAFTLAVQARFYLPEPPVGKDTIVYLLAGMEAETADLGWVATSGTFSDEANQYAEEILEKQGIRVELIDGELLASMIVDNGLRLCLESREGE